MIDHADSAPHHRALEVVPGASHLFEEPGTLDRVARLAKDWIANYLTLAQSSRLDVNDRA